MTMEKQECPCRTGIGNIPVLRRAMTLSVRRTVKTLFRQVVYYHPSAAGLRAGS